MSYPFKKTPLAAAPSVPAGRLAAAWSLDPRTGRPVQAWSLAGDGPLSRARLGRPALRLVKG